MGDHTEALLVEYDPESITYRELLEIFWQEHIPYANANRQYRSAIFCHSDEQRAIAENLKLELSERKKYVQHTAIEMATPFYRAEEYHQHYLNKMQWRQFTY